MRRSVLKGLPSRAESALRAESIVKRSCAAVLAVPAPNRRSTEAPRSSPSHCESISVRWTLRIVRST